MQSIVSVCYLTLRNCYSRTFLLSRNSHSNPNQIVLRNMETLALVKVIEKLIPSGLAESWDNVGLLTQPSPPHNVKSMMLTNDLTECVLEEALSEEVDMIFSYHPPIFVPFKRLTMNAWKQRLIVKCLENRIAIYSPHTAADAVEKGVNDWLISAFDVTNVSVIHPTNEATKISAKLTSTPEKFEMALDTLKSICQPRDISIHSETTADGVDLKCALAVILNSQKSQLTDLPEVSTEFTSVTQGRSVTEGGGRKSDLKSPCTVQEAVAAVKNHLGLSHVRLALGRGKALDSEVTSVAVCAGSGSSVLRSSDADLLLTGEMSHHDVLDHVASGHTVILVEHSNSERGYLRVFGEQLTQALSSNGASIRLHYSRADKDPLSVC